MEIKQKTILALFEARCRLSPNREAAFFLDESNSWQPISWSTYLYHVSQISYGLQKLGITKGDCVAIMAPTSLYWEYVQLGALAAGCTVAGIDQNYPVDQIEHVFQLLNPTALFIDSSELLSKVPLAIQKKIKWIVLFEDTLVNDHGKSFKTLFFSDEPVKTINCISTPKDDAIIVFTSGTTGMPKAICYTHEQVILAIDSILNLYHDLNEDTVLICWLPLANLFQRVVNFCAIKLGATNYFLSNPRDLMSQIKIVNPHILIGVPKIFFRIQNAISQNIQEKKKPFRIFLEWALNQTRQSALTRLSDPDSWKRYRNISFLLDKFVISQIRQVFGLRLKYLISGSAPMPLWLLEWYEGIGLPVFEAYGVSENIIPIAMNWNKERKLGSVGKPLNLSKVDLAADGEVLVKGPGVFNRYWSNIQENSAKQPDSQGYWATNDIGYFDKSGFLFLTGRKSVVFKTIEGKWIAPERIEELFLYLDYIDQGLVFNLDIGKIAAILSINREKYFQRLNIHKQTNEAHIINLNEYLQIISLDIKEVLKQLPQFQHPKGIIITTKQFTINDGELTTNMKLRRTKIISDYSLYIKELESRINNETTHPSKKTIDAKEPILLLV